jgi:acetolactate synthase small subunit
MRWCFLARCEDHGRMQSRVMQILDHLLTPAISFSMATLDRRLFFSFIVEADEKQALRIESLLRKIYGMLAVEIISETATLQRMIALLRVRCDISERDEVLHFMSALNARMLMIRPLWVVFEVIGTPQEVEGIYQSALGYGLVDLVSSSCAFMGAAFAVMPAEL